ncbi:hypothetical protein ACFLZB_02185 [Nanoarchaeota archaeon]
MENDQDINLNEILAKPITLPPYVADSWPELLRKSRGPRVGTYSMIILADAGHKKLMVERTFQEVPPENQVEDEYDTLAQRLEQELDNLGVPTTLTKLFIPEDFYGRTPDRLKIQYLEVVRDVLEAVSSK